MSPSTEFRAYLRAQYLSRRKNNEGYSLRSFARTLDLSPSALSALLKGTRPLTEKMRDRLGLRLGLNPGELAQFPAHPHGNRRKQNKDPARAVVFRELPIEQFRVISEPHHYSLLELMKTRDFRWDTRWIARRLRLSTIEVDGAIERLERVGLLRRGADGTLADTTNGFSTDLREGLTHEAQRRYQRAALRHAGESVDQVPLDKRDNTSITFACRAKDLARAREMIKKFRRQLCRELEASAGLDEVYQLTIALCPTTHRGET